MTYCPLLRGFSFCIYAMVTASQQVAQWRKENPEHFRVYRLAYYAANKKKICAKARKYYLHSPEHLRQKLIDDNRLTYSTWRAMKNRCNNPHADNYSRYGGRGIKIKYTSFQEFLDDVGARPSTIHTIDRVNNNGHYERGNCRWATPKEQQANRRNSR